MNPIRKSSSKLNMKPERRLLPTSIEMHSSTHETTAFFEAKEVRDTELVLRVTSVYPTDISKDFMLNQHISKLCHEVYGEYQYKLRGIVMQLEMLNMNEIADQLIEIMEDMQ